MPQNTIEPATLSKAVGEARDFGFNFSNAPELRDGSGVTLESGAVTGGDGLTFGPVTVNAEVFYGGEGNDVPAGKGLVCRISGGEDDVTYAFAMTATLSNGRTLVMPCRLAVAADYE